MRQTDELWAAKGFIRRARACARACLLLAALLALPPAAARARPSHKKEPRDVYLFSYFKGNGEDGLHLAYSFDGFAWQALGGGESLLRPAVGKDRLMRDPQLTLGPGQVFHLVWTTSWTDPVIGHATSKDLIHWSEQQAIRPLASEPAAGNVWAPELFYDERAKQYLLFWATTIPGRFPATDKTGDGGLNHRIYLTTTKDFRSFTPTRLFYEPGFDVIDATVVRDGRRYIMFFKDETRRPVAHKNIRYATSERAAGPYGPASPPITGDYWAEGPTAIKVDGRWIVYFDKYRDRSYGAVVSEDLERWEDISAHVQFPEGARHGSVLRVPRKAVAGLLEPK
jgi:hypothetical protein